MDHYGLFGWADVPTIPQPVLDFKTGVADAASLSLGSRARQALGVDGGVNRCSKAYSAGEWASLGLGEGCMAYAGISKVGAAMVADGAAAMAFRNGLKRVRPGGMSVMPTAVYAARNGFRNGMAVGLNLTSQREAAVQTCLSKSQDGYSATRNNCGSPIQSCLKQIDIDTGNQTLPVSLGNRLLDMGVVNGVTEYPASRPSTGWSAPWAR